MADESDGAAKLAHAADKLLGQLFVAQGCGILASPGQQNGVELFGIGVVEGLVNFDLLCHLVVLDSLDLTAMRCDHDGCGSGLIQRFAGLDEFAFLEEIGGEDGHAESCETLRLHTSSSMPYGR